ncbi:nucleoside transporter-domain-containing protein [Bombardia bombarda]|uniref:Nucleoside transporter-domain-containing protein n=1 Tax=Bombardia bombarda TaxID=252184 RepID=A0AA40CAR1_9PEZI|nr:nucleoside transporter-domain-containing protein [Bombardia bombarda]
MDRIKSIFAPSKASEEEYEPLTPDSESIEGSTVTYDDDAPFSWIEYSIFALVGVAMLWAWNMFLAAAPYFQRRFQSDERILQTFQSAIISVSTITNLAAMLILTNIQSSANYPRRINSALLLNVVVFAILTLSTSHFLDVSAPTYLAFLLLMVACTAWAAGLMQNGAFSFAASFGRPEYTQAIMAGQGVAGILPPLAQMVSFLAVAPPASPGAEGGAPEVPQEARTAAFIYFLTAVGISAIAAAAFAPLVRRHNRLVEQRMVDQLAESVTSIEEAERAARRFVSLPTLFWKLHWVAAAVFLCFLTSMFFPVFTSKILSVRGGSKDAGRLFEPGAFIPLAFFFWNLGDLCGRVSTMLPFSLRHRPVALFGISIGKFLFLPLYLLCNIRGEGAVVESDLFYLLAVQFPFGLVNGWLGSSGMMAAGEWVGDAEREAAGGFMGLCLVAGLTVGSLLSFGASGI